MGSDCCKLSQSKQTLPIEGVVLALQQFGTYWKKIFLKVKP